MFTSLNAPHLTRRLKPSHWISSFCLLFLTVFCGARPAHAWKPVTHVYFADKAVEDARDNTVTLYKSDYAKGTVLRDDQGNPVVLGQYEVDPNILSAITSHYPQFRAGVFGPDAYPDIATGQQMIHPAGESTPDDPLGKDVNPGGPGTNPWLEHLWKLAYGPAAESKPENQTPANRAFVAGYMFHAAGDIYMHTFVNEYAGGPFHFKENAIKHILLEGYLTKRLPKMQDYNVSIDGGVDDFIYRNLTYGAPGSVLEQKLLQGANGNKSIPTIFTKMRNELQAEIQGYYDKKADFDRRYDGRVALAQEKAREADACGLLDFTCSKTVLYAKSAFHYAQAAAIQVEKAAYVATHGPVATYKEHWRDDIDSGLRAFPKFSHEMALALFFNPTGKADLEKAKTLAKNYVTSHLLSMIGLPDAVGGTIEAIEYVYDKLGISAIKETLKQLLNVDLDEYLIQLAFQMTKEELIEYFENPEHNFDLVLNNAKFDTAGGTLLSLQHMNQDILHIQDAGWNNPDEKFDPMNFGPSFNTLQMSKIMLMKVSEVNRLLADLGSSDRLEDTPNSNAILGFIRSLDAGNQWHVNPEKMVVARNGDAYRKIFTFESGDLPVGIPQLEIIPAYTELKPKNKIALTAQPADVPVTWSTTVPVEGGGIGIDGPNIFTAPQRVAENTTVTVKATATDGSLRTATMQILLVASPVRPKAFTWTGGGSADNWTDPYNWGNADYYPGEPGFEGKDPVTMGGGTANVDKPISVKSLALKGGRLNGGTLTVGAQMDWTGGTLDNTTEVAAGAVFNISGDDEKILYGNLTTSGATSWTGGGLRVADDGVFENKGEFDAKKDGEIYGVACCLSPTRFINSGTFVKSAGTGAVKVATMSFINRGTVELKSGNLDLGGGPHAFENGSTFVGPGKVIVSRGDLTLSKEVNASALSEIEVQRGASLIGDAAVLKGTPTIEVKGGIVGGTINLPDSSVMNVSGAEDKSFKAAKLTNAGTINWAGTGYNYIYPGTEITNTATGVIDLEGDVEIGGTACCVSPSSIVNRGVLTKSAGAGQAKIATLAFVNSGTINVQAGVLKVGGGPHRWETGSTLSGPGKTLLEGGELSLAGTTTVSGGHTLEVGTGSFLIGGQRGPNSTVSGVGVLQGGGTFRWVDGNMEGDVTLGQDLSTQIRGAAIKTTYKMKLTNNGALNWADAGTIRLGSGSVFTNNGTMQMAGDVSLTASGCCLDPAQFLNHGTFVNAPGARSKIGSVYTTNSGNMELRKGWLDLDSSFKQTGGELKLNGGNLKTTDVVLIQGGKLSGTGVIIGKVRNASVVAPGHSPGKITIEGDYEQTAEGALNIEIAGEIPGTEHDQLEVTGAVQLDGQLNLSVYEGYQPETGDGFMILKYDPSAKSTGHFKTVTGTYAGSDKQFVAEMTANGLKLDTVGGGTAPLPGDMDGNGIIQVTDAIRVLRMIVGLEPSSPEALAKGDVAPAPGTGPRAGQGYGDGQVSVQDAIRILRKVVGVEPNWP